MELQVAAFSNIKIIVVEFYKIVHSSAKEFPDYGLQMMDF